ncbi:MAG: DUF4293 family protein [Flavobacteriaceae bacterium]|jgi:hypothetical protein|nr:DUF4293 family protein [Flavobacteriaceae bacterium]
MIQRIQTVFLLLNFFYLLIIYLFFDPKFFAVTIFDHEILIGIEIYIISCLIITSISILLFKKRFAQLFSNKIQIFLHIIYSLIITIEFVVSESFNSFTKLSIPIICLIFIFLANKFIKKDEDLIKSIDRIR